MTREGKNKTDLGLGRKEEKDEFLAEILVTLSIRQESMLVERRSSRAQGGSKFGTCISGKRSMDAAVDL